MGKINVPFRHDFVGSFLRPEYLKEARADFEAGKINADALKEVEDKAITDLIEKQKKAMLLLTENSEERHGILTLCGGSME